MFKHFLLTLGVSTAACLAAMAQHAPSFAFGKPALHPTTAVAHAAAPSQSARPGISRMGKVQALNGTTSSSRNLIENLESESSYGLFVQSVERATLVRTLQSPGPYTVFAPTDDAFGTLPGGRLDELWKPANRALLYAMLAAHIVAGDLKLSDLQEGRILHTLAGTKLTVHRQGSVIELEDPDGQRARLTAAELKALNGTVYALDAVLAQP